MSNIKISSSSPFFKKEEAFAEPSKDSLYPYFSFRYICQKKCCMKNCSIEQFKKLGADTYL